MKTTKTLTLILGLAGTMMFFQNCGKAGMRAAASSADFSSTDYDSSSGTIVADGVSNLDASSLDPDNVNTSAGLPPTVFYKNKCTFQLRGANGARWLTERYILHSKNCDTEMDTVRTNNPKATIVGVTQNFVKDIFLYSKWKCTYHFRGQKGATWVSERYIETRDCSGAELDLVRKNNPNATITSVKTNFVHDNVISPYKNKCTFHFIRENGARDISERYVASNETCAKELAIVKANNPKSQIPLVEINYVYDPY